MELTVGESGTLDVENYAETCADSTFEFQLSGGGELPSFMTTSTSQI
jgi:hypothetical protein